jgi:hypothetical protein
MLEINRYTTAPILFFNIGTSLKQSNVYLGTVGCPSIVLAARGRPDEQVVKQQRL